jgi:formylglycine-generating enzyme required for sulfatase activity
MNSKGRLAIGFFLLLLVLLNFRCNKSEESITPKPPVITLPQVETTISSNVSETTAVLIGKILSNGGETLKESGFVWGVKPNPTKLDSFYNINAPSGAFSTQIKGLSPLTTYYFRAYAVNSAGISYGNEKTFITLGVAQMLPIIKTIMPTDVTASTVKLNGELISNGTSPVLEMGFCYGLNQIPTVLDIKTAISPRIGNFTAFLIGINEKTKYYVRAFARSNAGIAYGEELSFQTPEEPKLAVEMLNIPGGSFLMGSPTTEAKRDADEGQYTATISAFEMSKYEMTNEQFAIFLNLRKVGSDGKDPTGKYPINSLVLPTGAFNDWGILYNGRWVPHTGSEKRPILRVSWYGAKEFARHFGGRLPTEAEWEYACRAGTSQEFNTGKCISNMQANYNWKEPYETCVNTNTVSVNATEKVGLYPPNNWGLYDMHGNVNEWCEDWYGAYPTTPQVDPKGPSSGTERVVRGGSYPDSGWFIRSASRGFQKPNSHVMNYGFRIVIPK